MYSITYLDRQGGVGGRATCLLWELNQLTTTVQAVWPYNDILCVRLCRVMPGRRAESGVGKYNADRVGNLLPSFLCKSLVFRQKSVNRSFALFKSANCSFPSFEKSEKSNEEQSALNRSLLKEHRHFCHPNWYDNKKEKIQLLKRVNYLK